MIHALTSRITRGLPHNSRINRLVASVPTDALRSLDNITISVLDLPRQEHSEWVRRYIPDHRFSSELFKKPIEFFATYKILSPQPADVFLDAAGGVYTYLHRIQVGKKIMQDLEVPQRLRNALGPGIQYVESDAGAIPLPDGSVDKIACHHSFEHFEGDSDTRFIREVQRLLAPGGRACILPLFVSDRYFELTNHIDLRKRFDKASHRVIDPTATLPGGNGYARIYDLAALERRVLSHIDRARYKVSIIELSMDGREVPDLDLAANRNVAVINRPFRALVIDRLPVP